MQRVVYYAVDELTGQEQQVVLLDENGVEIQNPEDEDFFEDGQYEVIEYFQEAPQQQPEPLPPVKEKKTEKKEKKPKQPPNGFMLFSAKNRKQIVDENPKLTNNEISQAVGARWKNLLPEEKKPYLEEAQRLRDEYNLNNPDLKKTNLKRKIEEPSVEVVPPKIKQKEERIKRPPNSFMFFMKEKRMELAEMLNEMKSAQRTTYLGDMWKSLTREQKYPWEQMAAKAKKEHMEKYPDFKYTSVRKPKLNSQASLLYSSSTYPSSTGASTPRSMDSEESNQAPEYDDLNQITPTVRVESNFPWQWALQSIGINTIPSNY
uniref:Sex-determining region Y protein n=1 Tax=Caenorhabditis tropicalis TaxID=1561998 RepID=A0A1I7UFG5_9PELO